MPNFDPFALEITESNIRQAELEEEEESNTNATWEHEELAQVRERSLSRLVVIFHDHYI